MLVDARCQEDQLGAIEGPVVVDPASNLRVDVPGEAGQVRPTATIEMPRPDLLAFRLLRLVAHGRKEAREEPPLSMCSASPEGVAEEVEAGVLRVPSAVRVFAVHDLRLVGVQFETEGPEPLGDGGQQSLSLSLGGAVSDDVIRIALKR